MKFSVIVPVYNGEETIARCLDALVNQDYPEKDYEIIVVNDGSIDDTEELARNFSEKVKIINLESNRGRVIARETGAYAASNNLLFYIDSRSIAEPDVLKKTAEIGYQPLGGGDWGIDEERRYNSFFDTFFYLLRRKKYRGYFPQYAYPDKSPFFYLDENNFNEGPKGMTCFLVDKKLFLSSLPACKGKDVNDDTRILREIVKKKKIMRHSDVKFTYLQRAAFREVMRHIYERGPRFADYYLRKGRESRKKYIAMLLGVFVFFVSAFFYPKLFVFGILGMLIGNIFIAIWLSDNLKDFFASFCLLPPVATAFAIGVLKWQIKWGSA